MPRQLSCSGMCTTLWWWLGYDLDESKMKFHQIWIECLVKCSRVFPAPLSQSCQTGWRQECPALITLMKSTSPRSDKSKLSQLEILTGDDKTELKIDMMLLLSGFWISCTNLESFVRLWPFENLVLGWSQLNFVCYSCCWSQCGVINTCAWPVTRWAFVLCVQVRDSSLI